MSRGAKYLRSERHLNKFVFALADAQFYAPFESRYEPSSGYLDLVTDLANDSRGLWAVARDGFWIHVQPCSLPRAPGEASVPLPLPPQGWKVHVSATLSNDTAILTRAARVALENEIAFKFALDRNVLSLMNSKAWPRSRSGKFITIYPSDLDSFTHLLEKLYAELRSYDGPYILSDRRYKDCRVLYYRYGGIQRVTLLEITGKKTLILVSPDGAQIPDTRTPYFSPPTWVTDPFPSESSLPSGGTLNAGRYQVKEALAFSNSGGVYLAEDRNTGRDVVLKEARPYTLMDAPGYDAIKLLKKEQEILEELRGTDVAAEFVDAFHDWEHFFLAEEYLDGLDAREIMLTRSPLMRVEPSLSDSETYYEIFRKMFTSFAERLSLLHERGIVFGDLSHTNLKVDPSTWAVRLIDLEAAFRPGVDRPTFLYTPGYKSELSIRKDAMGFDEDLYSLAAIMLYMIFPISVLASLRDDLYDTVLRTMLADIGWSETEVFTVIRGLSTNEITCARASELLAKPAQILPPRFGDEIDADSCKQVTRKLGTFLLANMRPRAKEGLFPADPFVHQTNYLSLGFGACGVLYTLKKCGFDIPERAYGWLEQQLDDTKPADLAPGLLTGAAGIAWCLWDLGLEERATELMRIANESSLLPHHHSYFYGMAGVGMANLYLHLRTGVHDYVGVARDLARTLADQAKEDDRGLYWENKQSDVVQLGFGYGQSGLALFFLRLFEITGDQEFLAIGKRALEFDLSHAVENENGGVAFPGAVSDPTLVAYLEEGSAGIAKVAMRYGIWEGMAPILSSTHRKYAAFPGLLYGLGSFVDVLTDAFLLSGDGRFLEMAKRPICGLRDLYLMEKPTGLATPGDGLLRITCDYATGVAGVMRALQRFSHHEQADFVLDEVGRVSARGGEGNPEPPRPGPVLDTQWEPRDSGGLPGIVPGVGRG